MLVRIRDMPQKYYSYFDPRTLVSMTWGFELANYVSVEWADEALKSPN